ncbi:olfactory receptor 13C9 [Melanotaenia boesemani]|uniref:olfactory receptor 13C9 n=1 Tax=Melanotaenia boesemani TaxID=1250792 RepID=UPI001C054337|nr:olfactory receptor 13C9 [Melanotaenia boesemani]
MPVMETQNITTDCHRISQDNQTQLRTTEQLDAAADLFHSLLPHGQTVPLLICIFVLLTLFSCLINVFTLSSIGQSDDLSWQPRFAFCKNLIFSDLIQTLTIGPAVIHALVQRRTTTSSFWCYVQYFMGSVSIFSSLVTITCMTLERYLYICYAMQYLPIFNQNRLRLALVLIWVYSISIGVINLSLLMYTGRGEKNDQAIMGLLCAPDIIEQHMGSPRTLAIFRKGIGSFTLVLCLLTHAFSYFRMYEDARNAVMPFKAVNVKARKTVMFYSGMLFLQLLPLLIKVTSDIMWEFKVTGMVEQLFESRGTCKLKATHSTTAAVLHVSLLVMLLVPPCINPLVYGLRNVEIKRALTNLFQCILVEYRDAVMLPMERRDGNSLDQNQVLEV